MKVMVTGGAGFIGSHVVERLQSQGCEVFVVDNLSTGSAANLHHTVSLYRMDIADPDLTRVLSVEKPEKIIHLAAQTSVGASVRAPEFDAQVNIMGTINLLQAARQNGVQGIVYSSSAAVYGNPSCLPLAEDAVLHPLSPYGVSKLAAENYVMAEALGGGAMNAVVLRYANVYGPRQAVSAECGVITIFINAALAGTAPTIHGDGSATRDYVYVGDVAEATWQALNCQDNAILNVSSGREVTVDELWQQLTRLTRQEIRPIYGPERPGDIYRSALSPNNAMSVLGWQAKTELAAGLKQTVDFYNGKSGAQQC